MSEGYKGERALCCQRQLPEVQRGLWVLGGGASPVKISGRLEVKEQG